MQFLERFGLADLLELHGRLGGSSFSPSCVSLAWQRGREYTRSGGEMRITPPRGSGLGTQLHRHRSLHWGSSTYPLATMSSRVVREKEGPDWLWAEKGAVHDLVNSSCTYWVLGTGAECWEPAWATPRSQSSSRDGSRHGEAFHTSPTFTEARVSIAAISGPDSGNAATSEVGSAAEPTSPDIRLPSDAAIDIWSSRGAPKVTTGTARGGSARPLGSSTGCSVMEEWGAQGDWLGGVFLTVTLRSPRLLTNVGFFWAGPEEGLDRGIYRGAPVSSTYWSLDLNDPEMVMSPQSEHVYQWVPPQRVQGPNMWGSNHDHHRGGGGTVCALLGICSLLVLKRTGKWPQLHNSTIVQGCCEHSLFHWRRISPRAVRTAVFAFSWDRDQHCQCRHTRTRDAEAPFQTSSSSSTTFEEERSTHTQHMCSAPKRKANLRRTFYSLNNGEIITHWLVFLTLEVDWSPQVIPNLSVSSDVRWMWPTERELGYTIIASLLCLGRMCQRPNTFTSI